MELDETSDETSEDLMDAWGLAVTMNVDVDLGALRPTFDELADAMLTWAGDSETEALSARALETVWSPELAAAIREGLEGLTDAGSPSSRRHARHALTDLARRGRASEIAHAVVQRVAMELSFEDSDPFLCLSCLDEAIGKAPFGERRRIALEAAPLARRDAGVPAAEIHGALRNALGRGPADSVRRFARLLATDRRRRAVRARFARLSRLGRASLPDFSGEVMLMLAGGLPSDPDDDELWQATCLSLLEWLDADAN